MNKTKTKQPLRKKEHTPNQTSAIKKKISNPRHTPLLQATREEGKPREHFHEHIRTRPEIPLTLTATDTNRYHIKKDDPQKENHLRWALTDSNRRPSACKADALNQLS